ncbi:MAG: alpha/beta fold hydrolase [Pseudomonadota bacterium]
MIPQNNKLFIDPGLPYPISNMDLPFNDYISQCKTLIENTRLDLNESADADRIIKANTPFELTPADLPKNKTRYGALLIHGLYDCPFVMRDLGEILQAKGLLVRSVLLPGHGTVPGALLNVTYQDWVQAVHYGVTSLAQSVDKLFLVGFSTGGALALHYLLNGSYPNIAGAITLAPAIKISPLARLAGLLAKSGRLWMHKAAEIDYAKYCSFTYNSAYQVYALSRAIQKLLQTRPLPLPQLIVISEHDKTVRSNATLQYFQHFASLTSQLILYQNAPPELPDSRIIVRPSAHQALNIIDMSHIALPIAPDNAHYGKNGDYPLASHIQENLREGGKILYGTYNTWQNEILNALNKAGLVKHERVRLTFNPDFDFLQQTLLAFVEKIISSSLT